MICLPIDYAELKTLYRQIIGSHISSVALTSATGAAGVTVLSIALAERAALDGKRVLLIDMNLASPQLQTHFHADRSDWTPDNDDWKQAVFETPISGVWLLPASTNASHPTFQSYKALSQFLSEIEECYDLAIMDCSPLQKLNQNNVPPDILCSVASGALLCVLTGRCLENQILSAKDQLLMGNVNLLGAVMNDHFAPLLHDELLREVDRLQTFFPRIAKKLRRWVTSVRLFNQDI